jgi:hypothetical protein
MRCLHCGTELPVFKRLSGQEFCSEDHRERYHQRYDRLALDRLRDAQPIDEPKQPVKSGRGPITLGLAYSPRRTGPSPAPPTHAPDKEAPAGVAGIVKMRPAAAAFETADRIETKAELVNLMTPERPRAHLDSPRAAFPEAAPVRLLAESRIESSSGRTIERRLENREFLRSAPVLEIHVNGPATTQMQTCETPVEVRLAPQTPSDEPALWRAPECGFANFYIESDEPREPVREVQQATVAVMEPAAVIEAAPPELRPERVTRPLPVTLHGVAAGRTRPMQVFSAPVTGSAPQKLRSPELPLRTVMVLGPAAKREITLPELRLSPSVSSELSPTVKISAGIIAVLSIAAGFLFVKSSGGSAAAAPIVEAGPPLPNAPDDWLQNFSPDGKRQRRVSLLRSSGELADYRVEFETVIQAKAAGWVYRAQDPKNFYVSKLEFQTPDSEPAVVAATHYAVINGQELPHSRSELPFRLRTDAVYKIRFQAAGSHFITWVQGQKADEWTDAQLKRGGVGLFSEDGERALLQGTFQVVPLMRKR